METAAGAINNFGTLAEPNLAQCKVLLSAQWLYAGYWFEQLFPGFTGPTNANLNDILTIKTILQLWILQFGPLEMSTWSNIKAAMNFHNNAWNSYEATTTHFTTDNWNTEQSFPPALSAWISTYCEDETCPDLKVFNVPRSECDNPDCNDSIKIYCKYTVNKFGACPLPS